MTKNNFFFEKSDYQGFSLVEIMIAFGVFSLFSLGVFSLFRSGQNASAQTFWLQKVMAELRNSTRHISASVQKSSYPSTLIFPGNIFDFEDDAFKMHYSARGTILATQAALVAGKALPGTHFLRFTEALPEKQGFQADDRQAVLNYHVYSLAQDPATFRGRILYHRYRQPVPTTSSPNYIRSISTSPIPTGTMVESQEIAGDIESVTISAQDLSGSPRVTLEFVAAYPRGKTRRTEKVVVNANVDVFAHAAGGDW